MECHIFLDKSLHSFSNVFLKEKIGSPFFFMGGNFLYGNLISPPSYEDKECYLSFLPYPHPFNERQNLKNKISHLLPTYSKFIIWINSNYLHQELIKLEIIGFFYKKNVKIIDLALSRKEQPAESTDSYYFSLYQNSKKITNNEIEKMVNYKNKLDNENGFLRAKYKNEIINVDFDYFDDQIYKCISKKPKKATKLIPEIMINLHRVGYILPADLFIVTRLLYLSNVRKIKTITIPLAMNKWSALCFCI